jgi:hypothetical protein
MMIRASTVQEIDRSINVEDLILKWRVLSTIFRGMQVCNFNNRISEF